MNIPKNLSEKEVIETITTIVNRIAPKYTFYGYDADDMKQEAFIICIDALDRYDQNRPLENFLSVNLSNRLKNFVRDNNFTKSSETKKKVLSPTQLLFEEVLPDSYYEEQDNKELFNIIDEHLPISMREEYLKIKNGVYISKKRRIQVIDTIKNILKDIGYEEGQDI